MTQKSAKILIADDQKEIVELLASVIKNMGLTSDKAKDGGEAIDRVRENDYDLIITDVRMPEATGIDILKEAKMKNPNTRVILISGYTDFNTSVSALHYKADGFIQKPLKMNIIIDVMQQNLEKKRLIDENTALNENLIKKNAELEKALTTIKQQHNMILHNERLKAIGTMAAGVAHEINNPLVFISTNVQTLEKYIEKMTIINDGKIEDTRILELFIREAPGMLTGIRKGISRMTKIISSLKTFAHGGKSEEEIEQVYISTTVEEALELCAPSLQKININYNKTNSEYPVKIVKQHLEQSIVNLLQNAADALKNVADPEINVVVKAVSNKMILTIKDNGTGIKKDVIEHIFDPFFTTKEVGRGTGIGLAITRGIIEKSGGTIEVYSNEKEGTTFTITWQRNTN